MAIPASNLSNLLSVRWEEFNLQPKFYEENFYRKLTSVALLSLAALAAASAAGVLFVTATPIAMVGFSLWAAAFGIVGIYLMIKPSENDPVVCRQKALEAGRAIETANMGYEQILTKYSSLIDSKRINVQAIRERIAADAADETLSFDAFMKRHLEKKSLSDLLIFMNDFANFKTDLKRKYLADIEKNSLISIKELCEVPARPIAKMLVTLKDVMDLPKVQAIRDRIATDAADETLSFDAFMKRHLEKKKSLSDLLIFMNDVANFKTNLKSKYLADIEKNSCSISIADLWHVSTRPIAKMLGITLKDVQGFLKKPIAHGFRSYGEFKIKIGNVNLVSDVVKDGIENLCLLHIKEKKFMGVVEMLDALKEDLNIFGDRLAKTAEEIVLAREQELFMKGELDYVKYRTRNGIACIKAHLNRENKQYIERLTSSFLDLNLESVQSPDYAEDLQMLKPFLDKVRVQMAIQDLEKKLKNAKERWSESQRRWQRANSTLEVGFEAAWVEAEGQLVSNLNHKLSNLNAIYAFLFTEKG